MSRLKVLLAVFAGLFACLEAGPAAAEDVLRWASTGGALTIDPHAYDENPTLAQQRQVYEHLIQLDSNLEFVPDPQPKHLFFAKVDNRETDFFFDSWAALDSESYFINYYRTGTQGAPGYSNPRVDELIAKIDAEMVTYARDAMIEEVWKIVLRDLAYIPLHHQLIVWAMRDNLDLPVFPFNLPLFREVRLKPTKIN